MYSEGRIRLIKGKPIIGGFGRGKALVSHDPISFLGDVDDQGVVVSSTHQLYGECIKDKILFFPYGRGSTVGSYRLYSLKSLGVSPKAIVNTVVDPVIVAGVIISRIPMMIADYKGLVKTGDLVYFNFNRGEIKVTSIVQ